MREDFTGSMGYTQQYSDLYQYNGYLTVHAGRFNEEHPVPSTCHLEIWESDTETLVIATELAINEGMSITNAYEWLATKVIQEHLLAPQRTRFIEHYADVSYRGGNTPDTYDLVAFSWNKGEASSPKWRRLSKDEIAGLPTS